MQGKKIRRELTEERIKEMMSAKRIKIIRREDCESDRHYRSAVIRQKNLIKKLSAGVTYYEICIEKLLEAKGENKRFYWYVQELINKANIEFKQPLGLKTVDSASCEGSKNPFSRQYTKRKVKDGKKSKS